MGKASPEVGKTSSFKIIEEKLHRIIFPAKYVSLGENQSWRFLAEKKVLKGVIIAGPKRTERQNFFFFGKAEGAAKNT